MNMMASQITCLTIVYSTVYSRHRTKKTLKLRVTGHCVGNSPVIGEIPAQRDSNAQNISIWCRHRCIDYMGNRTFSFYGNRFQLLIPFHRNIKFKCLCLLKLSTQNISIWCRHRCIDYMGNRTFSFYENGFQLLIPFHRYIKFRCLCLLKLST